MLKRDTVNNEERIERSCEVSRRTRTDFGEPEYTFDRKRCSRSADRLQPAPQCIKWEWMKSAEICPRTCTKWPFFSSSGKVGVFVLLRGVLVTHTHVFWLTYDANLCGVLTNHWLWEQHMYLCYNCCHFGLLMLVWAHHLHTFLWDVPANPFPVLFPGSYDVNPLGKLRSFLSYVHCRENLNLMRGKTYLIMGGSKQISRDDAEQSYVSFFYLFGCVGSLTIMVILLPILQLSFLFSSTTFIMLINMNIQVLFFKYLSPLRLKEFVSSGIST